MKLLTYIFVISVLIYGCDGTPEISSINAENWSKRSIDIDTKDSLESGKSYLSIYSEIYSMSEHITRNLTAMASIRNTSYKDTIFIEQAKYYDTHGTLVRSYLNHTIYLAPLETTVIVIDEIDETGGSGSNFLFSWKTKKNCPEPFFEAVMNSTIGQQGLSFTTTGRRIE